MIILCFGAACTFIQTSLYGLTGERIGNSLRKRLFKSLINQDIEFYDENRTGELLSRISSDTQIVQEGLTTSVAQAVKEFSKIIVVIVIISFYSWQMALIAVGCVFPSLYVSKHAMGWMIQSGVVVQGAKAAMSSTVEESLSNIKTVKAFAEEKGHVEKFEKANWEVFEFGRSRAYFWALFFFSNGVLG